MIKRSDTVKIVFFIMVILVGLINCILISSPLAHIVFVLVTTIALMFSVVYKSVSWIDPYSLMVISFTVFVWIRYIIGLFFDFPIISAGIILNNESINLVAVYLGISMSIICISSLISSSLNSYFSFYINAILKSKKKIAVCSTICNILLFIAFFFFVIFLANSFSKINMIISNDYFSINEGALLQGYRYFTIGKHFLILWLILRKDTDSFYFASALLAVCSVGYLVRGARGYAIMYFLMWILFYSLRHKIKLGSVVVIGLGIIFLANFILSYRLGWRIASGFWNIIIQTLYGQGASLETVYGAVMFKSELISQFNPINLLINIDDPVYYVSLLEKSRGINFSGGGFGSSFFAEVGLLFPPVGFLLMIIVGILEGILKRAYVEIKNNDMNSFYSQFLLFMTMPNLIYIARSSLKDFIFKAYISLFLCVVIQSCSVKHTGNKIVSGG